MAKRIVTKVGDIFCEEIDNQYKRYFQYIVNDLGQLNSSVIRVFKTHYPIGYVPLVDDIIKDEIEFYAHTILKSGIIYNAWYKYGQLKEIGNFKDVIFRTSGDSGNKLKTSEKWYIWHINELHVYVGKLTKEYQQAELGSVMPHGAIIERLRYGKYTHVYPGY